MDMSWQEIIKVELVKPYFTELEQALKKEVEEHVIYPPKPLIFKAFELTRATDIKVVVLGQDPYFNPDQANGLAFSVNRGQAIPKSLKNIYQELSSDMGMGIPNHGDLTYWAKQGVLLLNTVLTVRKGEPNSHRYLGWERFTDQVIRSLSLEGKPKVFLLWGNESRKKRSLIDGKRHLVLEAPHPSPLSAYRGFFGCRHFSRANQFLIEQGRTPIDWDLSNDGI